MRGAARDGITVQQSIQLLRPFGCAQGRLYSGQAFRSFDKLRLRTEPVEVAGSFDKPKNRDTITNGLKYLSLRAPKGPALSVAEGCVAI